MIKNEHRSVVCCCSWVTDSSLIISFFCISWNLNCFFYWSPFFILFLYEHALGIGGNFAEEVTVLIYYSSFQWEQLNMVGCLVLYCWVISKLCEVSLIECLLNRANHRAAPFLEMNRKLGLVLTINMQVYASCNVGFYLTGCTKAFGDIFLYSESHRHLL